MSVPQLERCSKRENFFQGGETKTSVFFYNTSMLGSFVSKIRKLLEALFQIWYPSTTNALSFVWVWNRRQGKQKAAFLSMEYSCHENWLYHPEQNSRFLSFGNKFKFGREGARRLRLPGAPAAFVDKEVVGVSVASEEAGFGPKWGSLLLLVTNLSITVNKDSTKRSVQQLLNNVLAKAKATTFIHFYCQHAIATPPNVKISRFYLPNNLQLVS